MADACDAHAQRTLGGDFRRPPGDAPRKSYIPENKVICGNAFFGAFRSALTAHAPAPRSAVLTSIREPMVILAPKLGE